MTTGEHDGYGYGDPAYPPSPPAYPSIPPDPADRAYPADPAYPVDRAYPADPAYGAGYGQPDPRYQAPAGDPDYRDYPASGYPPPSAPPADWYPPEDRYLPPVDRGYRPPVDPGYRPNGRAPVPGARRSVEDHATAGWRASPEQPTDVSGKPKKRKKRLPLWQELPLLLVIAFCLAVLIRTFLLQAFYIPSGSMEDTLLTGDRVLVDKVVYNFRDPVRGEVVVFRGTDAWAPAPTATEDVGTIGRVGRTFGDLIGISRPGEKDFIKRVIGLPGDVVSCCSPGDNPDERHIYVNGVPIDEPYVIRDSPLGDSPGGTGDCRFREFPDVAVEPGHIFVMGDHRQRSQDSRCQGQVPIENVIGRARFVVWPHDRWTSLSTSDAFDEVPEPAITGALPATAGTVPAAPGQLGLVAPLLLPLATRYPRRWARRRRGRRAVGRRLAE